MGISRWEQHHLEERRPAPRGVASVRRRGAVVAGPDEDAAPRCRALVPRAETPTSTSIHGLHWQHLRRNSGISGTARAVAARVNNNNNNNNNKAKKTRNKKKKARKLVKLKKKPKQIFAELLLEIPFHYQAGY